MIRVNDKWDIPWQDNMTVEDVLTACGFTHVHIVVSVNDVLVPPGDYAAHTIVDGDQVHVIHVIGGG
jgi:thiamine biosynthesis protein ThiS